MRQADIFIRGEADKWLARNRAKLGREDLVSEAIERAGIKPEIALEIGCSNGWRLAALRDKYGCKVVGLEPGHAAAKEGRDKYKITIWECTATALPLLSNQFDVVIYGFCLYLADPADWFSIVKEGDRVLKPGGYLIIHDFTAHEAWGRTYEHCDGVVAYHVDFAGFWRANPLYRYITAIAAQDQMATVLQKLPLDTIEVMP